MSEETIIMYRPVGPKELELIAASGYRAFPPRLPEQPIFYPVLNEEYANDISRKPDFAVCSPPDTREQRVIGNFLRSRSPLNKRQYRPQKGERDLHAHDDQPGEPDAPHRKQHECARRDEQ